MIPLFDRIGNLLPGLYEVTGDECVGRFGSNLPRRTLIAGLRTALTGLHKVGCQKAYIDRSFVSAKPVPGDFDACWDAAGVDLAQLEQPAPSMLRFADRRAEQKARYGGELLPIVPGAGPSGTAFLDFFQTEKETGDRKGIVFRDLRRLP